MCRTRRAETTLVSLNWYSPSDKRQVSIALISWREKVAKLTMLPACVTVRGCLWHHEGRIMSDSFLRRSIRTSMALEEKREMMAWVHLGSR